jgi:hypothetical protein
MISVAIIILISLILVLVGILLPLRGAGLIMA